MTKHAGGALLPSIAIDRASATPLGAQLAHALRELIVAAVLRPGDRLPSSRTLAADLGLSRTTVVDVYDQLTAEGLIASRVGDGAYVSAGAVARPARPAAARRPARLARLAGEASERLFPRLAHPGVPRAFVTGTPAYDAFPMPLWSQLAAKVQRGPRAAADALSRGRRPAGAARGDRRPPADEPRHRLRRRGGLRLPGRAGRLQPHRRAARSTPATSSGSRTPATSAPATR